MTEIKNVDNPFILPKGETILYAAYYTDKGAVCLTDARLIFYHCLRGDSYANFFLKDIIKWGWKQHYMLVICTKQQNHSFMLGRHLTDLLPHLKKLQPLHAFDVAPYHATTMVFSPAPWHHSIIAFEPPVLPPGGLAFA